VFDVQQVAAKVPVARSLEALAMLAPQTVVGDSAFNANGRSTVALAGSSVAENIYYINGMNITNFRTFVGGSTVPFEFYEQVQIRTGGYQAEFGRATGGALIGVTRSGSNEFKGGFNFYYEPDSLKSVRKNTYVADNSRDFLSKTEGNIWASGPIIKDKAFFFAFVNPRYETSVDYTRRDAGSSYNSSKLKTNTPFFGGKLDLQPFDGHRIEVTYFSDKSNEKENQRVYNSTTDALESNGNAFTKSGGDNLIAKYSGVFTNWLTVSALYGRSKYDQTSQSDVDSQAGVFDGRSGTLIPKAGNPNLLVEAGRDKREFYRADVDLNVSLMGEHQIRFGVDHEILTAIADTYYSGGVYWRYYKAGGNGALGGAVAPGQEYVRKRILNSGGAFESQNTAFYIQDNWDITDRLRLGLGVRNDRFKNLNAAGGKFVDIKNQWAPRLSATYDVFGDSRTKLSGFFGRYYLPIAANTNIRMAGNEKFTQQYFKFTSIDPITFVPQGVTPIGAVEILSDSQNPDPTTLVSQNLKPQYLDEFMVGFEHNFDNGWKVGVNGVYRKLGAVLEDADLNQYATGAFCAANAAKCGGESDLSVGSGGYVLLNPGSDAIINVEKQGGFAGGVLTIPAQYIDLPKAKRTYWGVELNFERKFDGVWNLQGSYTWSKSKGNYEGGVKSDNGQDDVGLTQDFDEPGWMDGSNGYLPNDRRHQFKLFGNWQPTEWFRLGLSARVVSPRKFGCIGIYPFTDGRAKDPYDVGSDDSWYCGDRSTAVDTDGDGVKDSASRSILVGRGGGFKGKWEKRIDLSLQFSPKIGDFRNVTLRADIFNVFNFKSAIDYRENGDEDNVITQLAGGKVSVPLDVNYGKPTSYQTPRYVRLGLEVAF